MRWRPIRSLAVRSSWQATVIRGRRSRAAMCSTRRVLPQPVGPLSSTARPSSWHCSNSVTSLPTGRYQGSSRCSGAPFRAVESGSSTEGAPGGSDRLGVVEVRRGPPGRIAEEVVDEQADSGGEDGGGGDQHQEVDLDLELGIEVANAQDPHQIVLAKVSSGDGQGLVVHARHRYLESP